MARSNKIEVAGQKVDPTVAALSLAKKKLTSLPDLSAFTRLSRLDVSHNALTSLRLSSSTIEVLIAVGNPIVEVALDLPKLLGLSLFPSELSSTDGLRAPALQNLMLSGPRLTSWPDLSGFPALKTLALSDAPLTSLGAAPESLGELLLSRCGLTSLSSLRAPGLWKLFAEENALASFDLPAMPQLEMLCVNDCGLTRLDDIGRFPALRDLMVSGNPLVHLEGFEALPKLEELALDVKALKTVTKATADRLATVQVRVGRQVKPFSDVVAAKKIKIV